MKNEIDYWKNQNKTELIEKSERIKQRIKNKPSVRMNNVYKWVRRNPYKVDYPKKWTFEEIEYAHKLQSK